MSTVNQLLAKAMNTSSEDEAMACLRMARKKATSLEESLSSDYKGHDAKYWYTQAVAYYNKVQEKPAGLSADNQALLYKMYKNAEQDNQKLVMEKRALEAQIRKMESKPNWRSPLLSLFTVILFQSLIIIMLAVT